MENMTLKKYLETSFDQGDLSNDDIIYQVKALFEEVLSFHEEGTVAPFDKEDAVFITNSRLDIDEHFAHTPKNAAGKLAELFALKRSSHLDIVGSARLDLDVDESTLNVSNLTIQKNIQDPIKQPVYVPGYTCFEILVGHHDDLTDIFCLGLILGSLAMGLDLYDEDDLQQFVDKRSNPSHHNDKIHPTLSALITEMTELDRTRRAQDLYDIIQRLEHYRDFDPQKQVDLSTIAGWKTKEISSKGQFILGKLRNRLFDTSRRNRLLYYKPNMRFVNLSVSSVPMVLHYQSIRPELLFTWNAEISSKVKDMKEIVLNKYLRFDDHQYLTSSLDKIRTEAQHDIQEYGFSQLKLVIAFLNWHNLKEDKHERINSPLLLIPVELRKNKKLKEDHYVMKVLDNQAEVNPIVSNQLRDLYGIKLPDFIDLDDTTVHAFYEKLKEQIDHANQGIALNYIDKPRIKLIHSVAKQTVGNYKRRLRKGGTALASYKNIDYSYQHENFKPLGLEMYRQRVEHRASMLEFLVNDEIQLSSHHLTGTKERELYELTESESNPYSWDVDVCNTVLGNFNYKKMSLVRDYNQVIDKSIHHSVFEHLFSDQPKQYNTNQQPHDHTTWHHVITADPTQTNAILQSRTGESYIIQGPPGTGKSQTITNLIADFVARGKKVLFVCEKRAALDVVYHRLKQNGLDELCCYIHDSQGDKRDFIRNLKSTYEDFIKNRFDSKRIKEDRDYLLSKIGNQLELLKQYHDTNAFEHEYAGMQVRKLLEKAIEMKGELVDLAADEEELVPYFKEWQAFGNTIKELSAVLEETGADPWLAGHSFSNIKEQVFLAENPVTVIKTCIAEAKKLLNEISKVYDEFGITEDLRLVSSVNALIEDAVLLSPLADTSNISLVDLSKAEAQQFQQDHKAYKDLQRELQQSIENNAGWKNKFSEQDVTTALPVVTGNEKSFFSFFNGNWRKLKKQLNESYDFSRHQVRPAYSVILQQLQHEYELNNQLNAAKRSLEQRYHLTDVDVAQMNIERIRAKQGDKEVDFLLQHPKADQLIKHLHRVNPSFWQLEASLKALLYDHEQRTLTELHDELDNILANLESLRELLPSLRNYAQASTQVKQALRSLPIPAKTLEAAMAGKTLRNIYQHNRTFESTDGNTIETAISQIDACYRQLLKVNADYIRAKVRNRFVEHLELSNTAISQLNNDQKAFKKSYAEGRKILENEFGKSMRYKSIRELAGKESGLVLKDLKPVWLMSPLSVSDSMPVDGSYFDVVIFDEASQITLEEGIPSLYRAPQTIIVGDDKQMPPTNFFSAKAEDPDDLDTNTDDEDLQLTNDADSLLVQGSRKLNSVMLGWHYRSRYETLISYSNHAFYEASLLTIPDKTIHHTEKPRIGVSSPTDGSTNVDTLFDRSISFHFHTNSTYEKRVNLDEANYIAHLVRELLKRKVPESIGIVAFSQEQQHTIEDALTLLASNDKEFEALLEEAYARTENDQYVGLIIKNLENIQGDERDIIIMSICYGPDSRKKMIMNFGPINKKGGEKRLNVIFSRAKKHMAVVSSIHHHSITNEYNEGANYFRRFLHYAEQVSTGNMALARTILDSLVLRKEAREATSSSVVLQQLKAALQQEGLQVNENIGQSGFRCSLGIKTGSSHTEYDLGILLDDDSHYNNANILEQYYQRPAILRSFGWNTLQVFTKDWLQDPQKVVQQVKKRLAGETPTLIQDTSNILPVYKRVPTLRAEIPAQSLMPKGMYDQLAFTRLEYVSGTSNKFWEAAVDESKLIVRFGRIGTKGQTQIKSFPTTEAADGERQKQVKEKVEKGYKEM
jgi:superfamily I DNA and/or RNA helicase/predicted DNA-binding WGR domain protein